MPHRLQEVLNEAEERAARAPRESGFPLVAMQAAALLTLMLVAAAGLSIVNLHERVEKGARTNLAQLSMVLAEETSRSFQAIDLVLRNAIDHLAGERLERGAAEAFIASRPTHEYLREKMSILPQ